MKTYQLTFVYIEKEGDRKTDTVLFDATSYLDVMNKVAEKIAKFKPFRVELININIINF